MKAAELILFPAVFVFFALAQARGVSAGTFDAGSRSQVFIDRVLVSSAEGVEFKLRPARRHPAGPWLAHESDGRRGPVNPMVLYDTDKKMFRSWSPSASNESPDGLAWSEPVPNPESWRGIRRISVIHDPDDPDPARRYKLVGFGPNAESMARFSTDLHPNDPWWFVINYNTYLSPDGREVEYHSREPILPGHDMISGYYDRRLKKFVAFPKTGGTGQEPVRFTRRRCFSVMTSPDFDDWSEPKLVFVPDEKDDEGVMARIEAVRPILLSETDPARVRADIYGIGGPIQLESCVIALPRVYMMHNRGDGVSEIQLAVSRDLETWERPFREAFIPRGKVCFEGGVSEWDSGWFNNEGPAVEVGDEVWVYYSARNTPHDHPAGFARGRFSAEERAEARALAGKRYLSGTGIAVWQRDRFVSASAGAEGGVLETVPLTFSGNRLEINAETGDEGSVTVELLGAGGEVIARAKPFSGDDLRHRVAWETPVALADLAASGTPVSLRFRLGDAALFAFAFRD